MAQKNQNKKHNYGKEEKRNAESNAEYSDFNVTPPNENVPKLTMWGAVAKLPTLMMGLAIYCFSCIISGFTKGNKWCRSHLSLKWCSALGVLVGVFIALYCSPPKDGTPQLNFIKEDTHIMGSAILEQTNTPNSLHLDGILDKAKQPEDGSWVQEFPTKFSFECMVNIDPDVITDTQIAYDLFIPDKIIPGITALENSSGSWDTEEPVHIELHEAQSIDWHSKDPTAAYVLLNQDVVLKVPGFQLHESFSMMMQSKSLMEIIFEPDYFVYYCSTTSRTSPLLTATEAMLPFCSFTSCTEIECTVQTPVITAPSWQILRYRRTPVSGLTLVFYDDEHGEEPREYIVDDVQFGTVYNLPNPIPRSYRVYNTERTVHLISWVHHFGGATGAHESEDSVPQLGVVTTYEPRPQPYFVEFPVGSYYLAETLADIPPLMLLEGISNHNGGNSRLNATRGFKSS